MYILAASKPASTDRSNEDWFSISSGLFIVLDGATARTSTGCIHGVSWYATRLGSSMSSLSTDSDLPLRDALSSAIKAVARQHTQCDLKSPGTPSAAIAAIRVTKGIVEYLTLGDISVILNTDSGLKVITDDRVDKIAVAERKKADRYRIGDPRKRAALIEMKHAELDARNKPGGFWVAAADPLVVAEAITGTLPISSVTSCAILTDGAARVVRLFDLMSWEQLLHILDNEGPNEILRQVRDVESGDPIGEKWARNKCSDDATIVYANGLNL